MNEKASKRELYEASKIFEKILVWRYKIWLQHYSLGIFDIQRISKIQKTPKIPKGSTKDLKTGFFGNIRKKIDGFLFKNKHFKKPDLNLFTGFKLKDFKTRSLEKMIKELEEFVSRRDHFPKPDLDIVTEL